MTELKLEHLAPYLPYGLMVKNLVVGKTLKMLGVEYPNDLRIRLTDGLYAYDANKMKPILHPLSDLIQKITVNGKTLYPYIIFQEDNGLDYMEDMGLNEEYIHKGEIWDYKFLPYGLMERLFEWKFDVFGLIKSGLAIDVNTLEVNPYE